MYPCVTDGGGVGHPGTPTGNDSNMTSVTTDSNMTSVTAMAAAATEREEERGHGHVRIPARFCYPLLVLIVLCTEGL